MLEWTHDSASDDAYFHDFTPLQSGVTVSMTLSRVNAAGNYTYEAELLAAGSYSFAAHLDQERVRPGHPLGSIEDICWRYDEWADEAPGCGAQNEDCWQASDTLGQFVACYSGPAQQSAVVLAPLPAVDFTANISVSAVLQFGTR